MTIITLTKQDTPSRPITLNTDFIAAVNPLRKAIPDPNSQTMQTRTVYAGSEVVLSNGTRYNVLESYPDVVAKLTDNVSYPAGPMPEAHQRATPAQAPPTPPGTVLAASGVPQLANTVTTTDSDAQPEPLDVLPTPIPEPEMRPLQPGEPRSEGAVGTIAGTPNGPADDDPPQSIPDRPADDGSGRSVTEKEADDQAEQARQELTAEPPAGTPLTKEELAAVAEHDAKPEVTSSPKPAKKAAAKKVTRQKDQISDLGDDNASPQDS